MPNNLISEPRFFLMVTYDFCTQRIAKFAKYVEKEKKRREKIFDDAVALAKQEFEEQDSDEEKEKVPLKLVTLEQLVFPNVTKVYEGEPRITKSLALRNFQQNRLEYDALKGSEYLNISFDRAHYKELLEYHAIYEFNNLKAKTFVTLNQFLDAYRQTGESQNTSVAHLC